MKVSISEIMKLKTPSGLVTHYVSGTIGSLFVFIIQNTLITPNIISFAYLFTILFGIVILYIDPYSISSLIVFFVCLHLGYVFDTADGQLARLKKMSSLKGKILDILIDRAVAIIIICSLFLIYEFNNTNIAVTGIVLTFSLLASLTNLYFGDLKRLLGINREQRQNKTMEQIFIENKFSTIVGIPFDTPIYFVFICIAIFLSMVFEFYLIYSIILSVKIVFQILNIKD